MVVIRSDGSVSTTVLEGLREPIERATSGWPGLCEAYVYGVSQGPQHPGEIVVRMSAGRTVVPVLFGARHMEPWRVFAALKGALNRADL